MALLCAAQSRVGVTRERVRVHPARAQAQAPAESQRGSTARRVALLTLPALLAARAQPASAEPVSEAAEQPLFAKVAKLGGILVAADVVTALVLGKSVLGIVNKAKGATEGDTGASSDWKERVADSLLSSRAGPPSSEPPPPPPAFAPTNAAAAARRARVDAMLARVRGQTVPPAGLVFEELLALISDCYTFTSTEYSTGVGSASPQLNPAGANEGACRVLAFAALHGLNVDETLCLFAQHYQEVLATPAGSSHKNIRAFRAQGWEGVRFAEKPLAKRRD